jgi:hypothetical protein
MEMGKVLFAVGGDFAKAIFALDIGSLLENIPGDRNFHVNPDGC